MKRPGTPFAGAMCTQKRGATFGGSDRKLYAKRERAVIKCVAQLLQLAPAVGDLGSHALGLVNNFAGGREQSSICRLLPLFSIRSFLPSDAG